MWFIWYQIYYIPIAFVFAAGVNKYLFMLPREVINDRKGMIYITYLALS